MYYKITRNSARQCPILKPGGIHHLLGLQDDRFTTRNSHGPESIQQPLTNQFLTSLHWEPAPVFCTQEQVPINDIYPPEKSEK